MTTPAVRTSEIVFPGVGSVLRARFRREMAPLLAQGPLDPMSLLGFGPTVLGPLLSGDARTVEDELGPRAFSFVSSVLKDLPRSDEAWRALAQTSPIEDDEELRGLQEVVASFRKNFPWLEGDAA